MTRFTTKRRAALIGLPVAAALLLGTGGLTAAAYAADTPQPASSSSTATGADHEGSDTAGDGQKDASDAKPSYTSSVTTAATEGSGSEAAADLAIAKLAKIDLTAAAKAAGSAVPGGTVTGIQLENEGGNVVYVAEVVTQTQQTEVVVDAGNGGVLAKTVEHDDGN